MSDPMRIGLVSDVHSNLAALEAVLKDMGPVDALWCAGDFVGYGPYPNECISLLREREIAAILGNHDLAAIGAISTDGFNPDAALAASWTASELTEESRTYLESLSPMTELDGVTLAHGTPQEPVWEYMLDTQTAAVSFRKFKTQLCFVGHTHIPSVFTTSGKGPVTAAHVQGGGSVTMGEMRVIANPGSVGQPRDRDSRAAYLVYDPEAGSLEWRRAAYDIAATQKRMWHVGLPKFFIDRLSRGV